METFLLDSIDLGFLGQDILNPYFYLLLLSGFYMSLRLGFPQVRYLFLSLKILTGNMDDKGSKGQIVHSQAFFAGLGSSILLGSLLGTSLAILVGGIGTLVWIWLTGFFVMPLRFVSSTLAIKFRKKHPSGRILSGPMYFIEKTLRAKWLALIFGIGSLITVLSFGAVTPMVAVTYIAQEGLLIKGMAMPIGVTILMIFIILGGIRRLGRLAGFLGPMGLVLFFISYYLLFFGRSTSGFLNSIIQEAFQIEAILGGSLFLFLKTMASSTGLFFLSTETGVGKSAGISGLVRTDYPAKHGLVGMIATFVESYIMATMIAYIYYSHGAIDANSLLQFIHQMLNTPLNFGTLLLYSSLLIFGILSLAGWFYTGEQNAYYLLGDKFTNFFRIVFVVTLLSVSLGITKLGGKIIPYIINYGFTAALITSVPLLISLMLLGRQAKLELSKYIKECGVRYEVFKDFYLLLLSILPKNFISKMFGIFSGMRLPRFMMIPILKAFARTYKINLDEAELELQEYNSLNQFFTRALRAEARIIDSAENAIVSPVDARITAFGDIQETSLIQAKGIDYSVAELIGSEKYAPYFFNGKYITFYLSPQDYHRIHSPFFGKILGYYYEPGKLFPVNDLAVLNIQSLFPKNERLITFLQTEYGKIAIVKVGASNVGKIRVTYDNKIVTNSWIRFSKEMEYKNVSIYIKKGGELGRFEMGSTVILLFEKDMIEFLDSIQIGQKIQYGTPIAICKKKVCSLPKEEEVL